MALEFKDFEGPILGIAEVFKGRTEQEIYDFIFPVFQAISDKIAKSELRADDFAEDLLEVVFRAASDGLKPDTATTAEADPDLPDTAA